MEEMHVTLPPEGGEKPVPDPDIDLTDLEQLEEDFFVALQARLESLPNDKARREFLEREFDKLRQEIVSA